MANKRLTKRWTKSKADELAVDQGCYFDLKAAERVRYFFAKFLRHSKGRWAGLPFELFDYQWADMIGPLFGWKRADGTRRFRRAFVFEPKKNGKSTTGAGIGLYMLVGDSEAGAEIYSLGTDIKQAQIVHGEAERMVEASPALNDILRINKNTHRITFPEKNAYYEAWTAEAHRKEGFNAHCTISDELHAWRGNQGRRLRNAIKYAGASRLQPLDFNITTAGDDVGAVWHEMYEYAKAVIKGDVIDHRFFALVYEADPEDDWTDEKIWCKANPSLGVTITVDDMKADCEEARRSPSDIASFKRYRLNIKTTGTSPWLDVEHWLNCGESYSIEDFAGERCIGALDLSKTRDLTSLVLVFERDDMPWLIPFFWLPENVIHDPARDDLLRNWHSHGWLESTPGDVMDYRFIKHRFGEIHQATPMQKFAYDPYNAEQVTQEITDEVGIERILFPQTIMHFAEPTAEFERLVIGGQLRHPNHPILNWQIGNVQVKSDVNNNKRPVKPKEGDHRTIDGVIAAIMALALREAHAPSVYESRGVLTLGDDDDVEQSVEPTVVDWEEDDDEW